MPIIYAGAVFYATAMTVTRPAQAVIVPSLARSAEELTATNVVSGWVESGAVLVASALTGALLAVSGVELIFVLMAVLVLLSALLVARIDGPQPVPAEGEGGRSEAFAGFGALRRDSHLRVLMGLLMGEFLLWGAMDILFVVLAIDVLALGQGWAGYFNAVFAAGGIARRPRRVEPGRPPPPGAPDRDRRADLRRGLRGDRPLAVHARGGRC